MSGPRPPQINGEPSSTAPAASMASTIGYAGNSEHKFVEFISITMLEFEYPSESSCLITDPDVTKRSVPIREIVAITHVG